MICTGRRTLQLFAVSLVALLLLLGVGEKRAAAQGYQVWSCSTRIMSDTRGSGVDWFSNTGWVSNFCPDGLEFPSGAWLESRYSEFVWEWSPALYASTLKKVTLTMKGGSTAGGVVYDVIGKPSGDVIATLPARAVNAADLTTSVNVPDGVKSINLRARCAATTCTGTAKLRISEIKFSVDDSTNPIADLIAEPGLYFGADGSSSEEIPWFRPVSMPLGMTFREEGSGLASASLTLDGLGTPYASNVVWTERASCASPWEFLADAPPAIAYERPTVCLGDVHPPRSVDLRAVSEGRHKLELSSADAMGLKSEPVVGWFGVDGTPPEAPGGFQISNTPVNSHGWTNTPLVAAYVADAPVNEPGAAPIANTLGRIVRDDAPDTPRAFSPNGFPQPFPSEGHFRIEAWFIDAAGNRGYSSPAYIGYDTTRPPAPQLDENDWVSRKQLVDGYKQSWTQLDAPADVESGICGYIVAYDSEPVLTLSGAPTIDGNVDSAPVPANLPEGKNFSHIASVSCAGLVSDTVSTPLPVDTSAPHISLDGLPSGQWSRDIVHAKIEPTDELSGVESVEWSLDGSTPQSSTGAVNVTIGDGKHVLTTSAIDRAGNESESSSTAIWVDSTEPASWLAPAAGGRINDFEAHVIDPTSGLDSAAVQFRRVDSGATTVEKGWRQAGAAFLPGGVTNVSQAFTRALDDSALADGTYELRVAAVDLAGNVGFGSTLPAGGTVVVNLPLRARPAVSLAISDLVRRCTSKSRSGCASSSECRKGARCTFEWMATRKGAGIDRIVNWGAREALTGSVRDRNGSPLGGVKVVIYSTPHGGNRALVHSLTTESDGTFEWRLTNGPTRSFTAVTGSTDAFASAESSATLAVRAGLSLKLSDVTPRPGQTVKLTGRLASGGLGVPAGGKTIKLEYWHNGEWDPTLDDPETDGAGRFHATWAVPRSSSAGTLYFRARAELQKTETTWPFEDGKSPAVRVQIHR